VVGWDDRGDKADDELRQEEKEAVGDRYLRPCQLREEKRVRVHKMPKERWDVNHNPHQPFGRAAARLTIAVRCQEGCRKSSVNRVLDSRTVRPERNFALALSMVGQRNQVGLLFDFCMRNGLILRVQRRM